MTTRLLFLLVASLSFTLRADDPSEIKVTHIDQSKVNFIKPGKVLENAEFKIAMSKRDKGGIVEIHAHDTDPFYIVDGEATLVDDAGEVVLTAGMCAGLKAGVPNGHKLVNRSAKPVTYLEIGTRSLAETAHYPDADVDMKAVKVNGRFQVLHKDGTPY